MILSPARRRTHRQRLLFDRRSLRGKEDAR